MDGWYHQMWKGLQEAEKLTYREHDRECKHYSSVREVHEDQSPHTDPCYFKKIVYYLRLFYTEEFLGWNSQFWPTYLTSSLLLAILLTTLLIAIRTQLHSKSSIRQNLLTNRCILFTTTILLPLCIILFFAAGKLSMIPIPDGVTEMPGNGCRAQGLVFPKD